ncbi:MAG: helix-turn-helix transcriptional regulator [bacterium]|nr:helix-turn-helix transcriptional regulator [bacterium]
MPETVSAMEELARNVVRKRAEHHLSQAALADRADVARATVCKIESGDGNVTVQSLERIARVLGCRLDELFAPRCVVVDDAELERRANAPDSDFVDARALLAAIDEANEGRYSRAGRKRSPVGR